MGADKRNKPAVQLLEILVLAFASMIWPALIAVVVVALATPEPVRLLSWFLAGALLTTVVIGSAIVLLLEESSIANDSRSPFGAAVDLVASAAAFVAAYIVWRRGRARGWSMQASSGGGWSERTLSRGGLFAFVVGVVLNVIPGVLPFVAMKNIAQLDYATGATLGLVLAFYLIMFLPAEIPLSFYLFAPERTTVAVDRFNAWLRRNALLLAVFVLAACGIYLAVRGIFAL